MSFFSLADLSIFIVAWIHVFLAPYTKVEESFNLHAVHDTLFYGVLPGNLHNYDHFIFPGAVPRTFIGSTLLAWFATPALHLVSFLGLLSNKAAVQVVVRITLATVNAWAVSALRCAVQWRFGPSTGLLFTLLSVTQFHLPFWMGRTLPNMFALPLVNVAHAMLLDRGPGASRPTQRAVECAIVLLTFSAVVFRSEIILLLGPLALQSLVLGHIPFKRLVRVGIIAGSSSVALTLAVDSYFWHRLQKPIWPELYGMYYNVYQGKSTDWGTSPTHAYLSTHLPKLLLSSLPLGILGCLLDGRVRELVFPSLASVLLLSALAHKEWRFVVYTVPVFNVAAARGARALLGLRRLTGLKALAPLVLGGLLSLNVLLTILFARASVMNYPGGEALAQFNARYANASHVKVHISNLAAQTGASLFQQTHTPPTAVFLPSSAQASAERKWVYDKTENLTPSELSSSSRGYTHLIVEAPVPAELEKSALWKRQWAVEGERWVIDREIVREVVNAAKRGDVAAAVEAQRLLVKAGVANVREEKLVELERK